MAGKQLAQPMAATIAPIAPTPLPPLDAMFEAFSVANSVSISFPIR